MPRIAAAAILLLLAAGPVRAQDDEGPSEQTEVIPDQQGYIESTPGTYAPGHGPNDSGADDAPPVSLPNDDSIRRENKTQPRAPEETAPEPKPEKLGPVTLGTARANWPAIVEAYVLRRSTGGAWTLRDKAGRTWRLVLTQTLADTVRRTGKDLYAGHALLKTARAPSHRLDMEFTVDFTGVDWKVKAYRIHKIDGKLRK